MAPPKFNFNSRTIVGPLAAFCMASILFVYSRTSIHAAKRNARLHREADGGQISWRNESLRRHGALEPPEPQGLRQLFGSTKEVNIKKVEGRTEEDERVREMSRASKRRRMTDEDDE